MTIHHFPDDIFALTTMTSNYQLITVSHKSLNTEDLEHFIIRHSTEDELIQKLNAIKKYTFQDEVLYMATCNRVLFFFYGVTTIKSESLPDFIRNVNSDIEESQCDHLNRIVESYQGMDAINHLFEVASSIDSLVVGEREIFRQFRDAYRFCNDADLCGDNIRLVQQSAVKAAKDVYTNTSIGTRPVSVVSLAIQEFLKKDLSANSRILLIGAGETNSTVGRFLKKHQFRNIIIFNRSLDNAKSLSQELEAEARHLGDLENYDEGFDCIFTCTASQEPILTEPLFKSLVSNDDPKLVVDLSIPHNVSKSVANLECVNYISIDNLRHLAEENLQFRSSNISDARNIIKKHLLDFSNLYERRKIERALSHLPDEIGKIKDRALQLVYKDKIDSLPSETQELISEIANYMEKKYVAAPMKMAKNIIK